MRIVGAVYEVTWLDACTTYCVSAAEAKNIARPIETHSVGYLFRETPKYVVLTPMCDGLGARNANYQSIPRGMIKSMRRLRWKP